MRKNSLDSLGNPVGLEETVINPMRMKRSAYDPRYRMPRPTRGRMERDIALVFKKLAMFMEQVIEDHSIDRIVFYGGQEDKNLLKRSRIDTDLLDTHDLQTEIRNEIGHDLSLDKASMMIDFSNNGREILSRHFRYHIPEKFEHLIIPHKAVGDVARIFMLDKEVNNYRKEFIRSARKHMERIESYREREEEIPLF